MSFEVGIGTMPARGFDWDSVSYPPRAVRDFARLHYGKALREPDRRPGSVPVFGTNGPCGWHDEPLAEGPGVILGRKGQGHLGVKWCRQPFWVIDTAYYAEINSSEVDLRWFYYITEYVGLDHLKTGEKPGLNRDVFGRQVFPFPPLEDQREIVRILGILDDKIQLNRQMIATLEAMARALFKSWFVDFDPVTAKAAGRHPFGMSDTVAGLFPDSFDDSPIGPIPAGWRVLQISDLLTLSRSNVKPFDSPLELFDHYSIPAFDDRGLPSIELGGSIKSNKYEVPRDCVLISKLNPHTPRMWHPVVTGERRAVASTEFLVCIPNESEGVTVPYLYALLSSEAFCDEFATLVTGTSNSHQRVKPQDFLSLQAVIGSDELIKAADRFLCAWLNQINSNVEESARIAQTRDALIPQLLSGEIRLRQAETLVEEVA